jgi:hypothetical protein
MYLSCVSKKYLKPWALCFSTFGVKQYTNVGLGPVVPLPNAICILHHHTNESSAQRMINKWHPLYPTPYNIDQVLRHRHRRIDRYVLQNYQILILIHRKERVSTDFGLPSLFNRGILLLERMVCTAFSWAEQPTLTY